MKAERCPVCYGTGKYTDPPDPMNTAVPMPRTCHGCGGLGWVSVSEDQTLTLDLADTSKPFGIPHEVGLP